VTNQAISSLGFLSGMTLCYDQPYTHATRTADLEACARQGSQVFVAATLDSTVVVGAGGATSCVFQATSKTGCRMSTARACNGAFWYKMDDSSYGAFGFAGSSRVHLCNIDSADLAAYGSTSETGTNDGANRLSWVMDYSGIGGWRAGTVYGLNQFSSSAGTRSDAYRKRIWVSSITTASPSYAGRPASIGPSFAAAASAVMSA
jgi:hypothetical protein